MVCDYIVFFSIYDSLDDSSTNYFKYWLTKGLFFCKAVTEYTDYYILVIPKHYY